MLKAVRGYGAHSHLFTGFPMMSHGNVFVWIYQNLCDKSTPNIPLGLRFLAGPVS